MSERTHIAEAGAWRTTGPCQGQGIAPEGIFLRRPRNAGVKRGLAAFGSLRGEKVPPSAWD